MTTSAGYIEQMQIAWARDFERHEKYPTYSATLAQNLFQQRLAEATRWEFEGADGAELEDSDKGPAKMSALLSSSALAVNFFDVWRGRPSEALGTALGLHGRVDDLRFEYVCEGYPVGPRSPNLDVLLHMSAGDRVAVESKFTEPFRGSKGSPALAERYFSDDRRLWAEKGMERAQALAESLPDDWRHLDAPQLLKHMLGLANDGCAKTLLYLWYDTGQDDANRHRAEIQQFAEAVHGDPVSFRSRTYQEAFACLAADSESPGEWVEYMRRRYFPDL